MKYAFFAVIGIAVGFVGATAWNGLWTGNKLDRVERNITELRNNQAKLTESSQRLAESIRQLKIGTEKLRIGLDGIGKISINLDGGLEEFGRNNIRLRNWIEGAKKSPGR